MKSIPPIVANFAKGGRYYISGLYRSFSEHHMLIMSGGIAYSLLLSLIPMIGVVVAVLGAILSRTELEGEIYALVAQAVPSPEHALPVILFLQERVAEFTRHQAVLGTTGIIILFFTASGLFSAMRTALAAPYEYRERGSIWIGKLKDIAMMLLVMFYFLLAILSVPILEWLRAVLNNTALHGWLGKDTAQSILVGGASILIAFIVFYSLYLIIPPKRIARTKVLVSTLTAVILWELARRIFSVYVAKTGAMTQMYGTFFGVVMVLLWVYYSAFIFIFSAEVGRLYELKKIKSSHSRTQ
jgi:membrane protein